MNSELQLQVHVKEYISNESEESCEITIRAKSSDIVQRDIHLLQLVVEELGSACSE